MPYQFTQTGAEIQDILDQVGTNTSDIATNTSDISTLTTALRKLEYHKGDTVVIGMGQYAGTFISGNTVRWFLPLSKSVGSDVTSVAITAGDWIVRTITGAITVDGTNGNWTVARLSSITYGLHDNGIHMSCTAPQSQSGINNTPVAVQTGTTFAITFS